jgi:DNA helicase II / ATP-dependent DNA helicase PcrA
VARPNLDLKKLNPEQREAVLYGDGPLLILAGAGSGKTSTMTYRIAHLVAERGVPASNILGMSFTNKAARELRERVHGLISKTAGEPAAKGLLMSTFHSFCVRTLREFSTHLGFTKDFTILSPGDQTSIVRGILKNIKVDDRKFDPDWMIGQIGQAKNKLLRGDALDAYFETLSGPKVAYDMYPAVLASLYPRYQESLKAQNAMDFDDLIGNTVSLLENNKEIRERLSQRYKHILIDEYQDTNPAQFRILEQLTCTHQNICVVGDDDQSIYAWRGADATHILEFKNHFKAAKTLVLHRNYRSTSEILHAANSVISKNTKRFPKSLTSVRGAGHPLHLIVLEDDRTEAEAIVRQIMDTVRDRGIPYKDMAILYRSNAQSRVFEEALRFEQIPYKLVGAMSFLDRKEIKDLLAYFRLILNPKDDSSFRRVVNWPGRGIGKTTLEAMNTIALEDGRSLMEVCGTLPDDITAKARSGLASFSAKISELRASLLASCPPDAPARQCITPVSQWAVHAFEVLGFKKEIFDEEEDPAIADRRVESALEIANAIGMIPPDDVEGTGPFALLGAYLARLALEPREEKENKDRNDVTLMTLHSAKGLEFPVVFLVGLEDGFLPHQRTIDGAEDLSEERRLFYVGLTRAKDLLYLSRCAHRIRYGKPVPRNPSRFLTDLPEDLLVDLTSTHKDKADAELVLNLEAMKAALQRK